MVELGRVEGWAEDVRAMAIDGAIAEKGFAYVI